MLRCPALRHASLQSVASPTIFGKASWRASHAYSTASSMQGRYFASLPLRWRFDSRRGCHSKPATHPSFESDALAVFSRQKSVTHADILELINKGKQGMQLDTAATILSAAGQNMFRLDSDSAKAVTELLSHRQSGSVQQVDALSPSINSALLLRLSLGLRPMDGKVVAESALLRQVAELIGKADASLSVEAITSCLFNIQRWSETPNGEMSALLKQLAFQLHQFQSGLGARAASSALYGMKNLSTKVGGVPELLAQINSKIKHDSVARELWAPKEIGMAIYGLKEMTRGGALGCTELEELVTTLAGKVAACRDDFDHLSMGNVLFGMRGLKSSHPSTIKLINAVSAQIKKSKIVVNTQLVSQSLLALQVMSSRDVAVRRLVAALADKLSSYKGTLTTTDASSALNGLRGMSDDCKEVRALLVMLTDKIGSSAITFDSKSLSLALFGLQNMRANSPELRNLLRVLTVAIEESDMQLSDESLGVALYGLQGMGSDSKEVCALVGAIAEKLQFCNVPMTESMKGAQPRDPQGSSGSSFPTSSVSFAGSVSGSGGLSWQIIGDALYGLQGMWSHSDEVRNLLAALTERIGFDCNNTPSNRWHKGKSSSGNRDNKHIGRALYGLRCMDSSSPEVRGLLVALSARIRQSKAIFDGRTIGTALSGLVKMKTTSSTLDGRDDKELLGLLEVLTEKIRSSVGGFTGLDVCLAVRGLSGFSSMTPQVRDLVGALAYAINASNDSSTRSSASTKGSSKTQPVTSAGVCGALTGLSGLHGEHPEVQQLLGASAECLLRALALPHHRRQQGQGQGQGLVGTKQLHPVAPLHAADIVRAIEALKNCDTRQENTVKMLSVIASIIEANRTAILQSAGTVGITEASFLISGLKDKHSKFEEVRTIVRFAAQVLHTSTFQPTPIFIMLALRQCKALSSSHGEVREFVAVLVEMWQQVLEKYHYGEFVWTGHNLANALSGMWMMNPDEPEVAKLVDMLAASIPASNVELSSFQIGMAINGLNSIGSSTPEARKLIIALTECIAAGNKSGGSDSGIDSTSKIVTRLKPNDFAHALRGLRGMSSDVAEVRALLRALVEKAQHTERQPTPQEGTTPTSATTAATSWPTTVVSSLFSFFSSAPATSSSTSAASSSSASSSSSSYSSPIHSVVNSSSPVMNEISVIVALQGLQGMNSEHDEVREVVGLLSDDIDALLKATATSAGGGAPPFSSANNLRKLLKGLKGLRGLSSDHEEVRRLLRVLTGVLKASVASATADSVAAARFGMLAMDPALPEVQEYLSALKAKQET